VRALLERSPDPYPRSLPLHLTGSALIVAPDSGRVLLALAPAPAGLAPGRRARRPGERDPLGIARARGGQRRPALASDLVPWPDAQLRHVVTVAVPAAGD